MVFVVVGKLDAWKSYGKESFNSLLSKTGSFIYNSKNCVRNSEILNAKLCTH